MAAYCHVWLTSPAGWLPRTGISSGTLRLVIEYLLPLPLDFMMCLFKCLLLVLFNQFTVLENILIVPPIDHWSGFCMFRCLWSLPTMSIFVYMNGRSTPTLNTWPSRLHLGAVRSVFPLPSTFSFCLPSLLIQICFIWGHIASKLHITELSTHTHLTAFCPGLPR